MMKHLEVDYNQVSMEIEKMYATQERIEFSIYFNAELSTSIRCSSAAYNQNIDYKNVFFLSNDSKMKIHFKPLKQDTQHHGSCKACVCLSRKSHNNTFKMKIDEEKRDTIYERIDKILPKTTKHDRRSLFLFVLYA